MNCQILGYRDQVRHKLKEGLLFRNLLFYIHYFFFYNILDMNIFYSLILVTAMALGTWSYNERVYGGNTEKEKEIQSLPHTHNFQGPYSFISDPKLGLKVHLET